MSYVRLADRVKQAEEIAHKNGGKLPRMKAVQALDHKLADSIYRHPEAYQHIPRRRSLDEYIILAEEIAKGNGGKLPVFVDLFAINHNLAHATMKHKDAFAHIPRAPYTARKAKRIAAYVKQAEALAKKNGGELLVSQELQTKYNAMVCALRKNPEAFAHIPRIRRVTSTFEEHVQLAEKLARENGGNLPAASILRKNYQALGQAVQKHPTHFLHLKQDVLMTPLEEHIAVAQRLAKRNKGILPHGGWLVRNGFRKLEAMMYRHPERFKGIKQELCDSLQRRISVRTY